MTSSLQYSTDLFHSENNWNHEKKIELFIFFKLAEFWIFFFCTDKNIGFVFRHSGDNICYSSSFNIFFKWTYVKIIEACLRFLIELFFIFLFLYYCTKKEKKACESFISLSIKINVILIKFLGCKSLFIILHFIIIIN